VTVFPRSTCHSSIILDHFTNLTGAGHLQVVDAVRDLIDRSEFDLLVVNLGARERDLQNKSMCWDLTKSGTSSPQLSYSSASLAQPAPLYQK